MRFLLFVTALALGTATPLVAGELIGSNQVETTVTVPVAATSTQSVQPAAPVAMLATSVKPASNPAPASTPVPASAPSPSPELSVDEQITHWIEALSENTGFESWKDADWTKYPLGPGKRGWVVIVRNSELVDEEAGYLVIIEASDGILQLEEYGVGEIPLFSMRTINQALQSDGLEGVSFSAEAHFERIYADALHAYWKVSVNGIVRFADAKTGEWLPIGEPEVESLTAEAAARTGDGDTLNHGGPPLSQSDPVPETAQIWIAEQVADPYMSIDWLDSEPQPIESWSDLLETLITEEQPLVYRADLYEGTMLIPFGIAGLHAWTPEKEAGALRGYVALEQDGLRYVPFEQLTANGTFR